MSAPHAFDPKKMLLALALAGALGLGANAAFPGAPWLETLTTYVTQPVGQIFLRLLFMMVLPLLFSALVMGVAELELRHLGRLGGKVLGLTVAFSVISVLIGLVLVNVLEPGAADTEALRALAKAGPPPAPTSQKALELLVAIVPDNVAKAAAGGDIIGVIAFSLLFGIGLRHTGTPGAARLLEAISGLFDVSMRLITMFLRLAPLGVGALLFTMTARLGLDVVGKLLAYVGVVLLGLALHTFGVLSLGVKLLGGRSPVAFFRDIRLAMATAFSTASSNATLPTSLKVAEEDLKLPRHVSRFVLTAGATMNQNGTALFEGVTVLFLAQIYGVPMGVVEQAGVMIVCVLAGIGTAGVPAGSLPVIAMILASYGIPPEGLGLILGVDRFLDMCRTTLNVTGDLAIAAIAARGEVDEPDPPRETPG